MDSGVVIRGTALQEVFVRDVGVQATRQTLDRLPFASEGNVHECIHWQKCMSNVCSTPLQRESENYFKYNRQQSLTTLNSHSNIVSFKPFLPLWIHRFPFDFNHISMGC